MAQEQPSIDCIYDFIYLDTKRLTSFLAQLDDNGVLLSIKKTKHIEEERKELGSVGLNIATKTTTENNETIGKLSENHYDPSSTALYSVIDRLDELGFIKKRIDDTAMGQLLLCDGTITFQDIRMMRNLWDPIMKLILHQESSQGSKNNKALLQHKTKEVEMFKSIISALPHALLMTLVSENKSLWSSLEEEHLKINSDDITLKHGATFAGHWHVLGILDAKPDDETDQSAVPTTTGNGMFDGMGEMLSAVRMFLGRPKNSYGITPVAIFRTVSAA